MNWLSALTFANPAALVALLALPVIWWLLRAVPPRPRTVRFPPFRILLGLKPKEEEAARTPWWLVALRLMLAAMVILAVAGPRIPPPSKVSLAADGPLLVVVDDGWAAARNWARIVETLEGILEEAVRRDRPVVLATTVAGVSAPSLAARRAEDVRKGLAALAPKALTPDRPRLLERLRGQGLRTTQVLWLSDGLDYGHAKAFADGLTAAGGRLDVLSPDAGGLPLAVGRPVLNGGRLQASVMRADVRSAERARVVVRARNGRPLADASVVFRGSARKAFTTLSLPLAIRNEAAFLTVSGQGHAGAVWLFDDRFRRKSVLVFSGETRGRGQPLLSPVYYIVRALQPMAEVMEAQSLAMVDERLGPGLSMLILADVGRLDRARRNRIAEWIRKGGVLLRFSGPRMAGEHDDLVPVRLRAGGRQLGAALSWEKPQALAPFPRTSPLAGLSPDREVRVTRQVLAEPGPELAERTWAALEDGTPLITARKEGAGLIVLVHTTASPEWSNLPMSGLFVDILGRILDLAPAARAMADGRRAAPIGKERAVNGAWTPWKVLDGFGALVSPPVEARPVRAEKFDGTRPSALHPPGLYVRDGGVRALNLMAHDIMPKVLPEGLTTAGYVTRPARDFAPALFIAAFVLFLLDTLAMLWISGGLKLRRVAAASVLTGMLLLPPVFPGSDLHAAEAGKDEGQALEFAMKATDKTRFAYVLTGNGEVDEVSRAGLSGLSAFLTQRTSVEPGEPMAVDIERDEIAFFPLIYWPVLPDAQKLSPKAVAKLDVYLKNGGTILFDTRDAPEAELSGGMTPAREALRRILSDLDVPPLEPAPRRHVLTRSFYLIKDFPGRYAGSPLWVEATSAGRERRRLSTGNADGVSAILITGNDMAGAWALTPAGRALLPVVPGGARQREYAIRAGINIVMYALTGNYKADQVHIPAILRRLGQ